MGDTAHPRTGAKDGRNDREASGAAMKPGMKPGRTAMVEVVVDATMFAAFEGRVVHPVYGTAAMIAHMELAGRRIILPYLEPHEEGVGYEIAVRHLAPTVAGM